MKYYFAPMEGLTSAGFRNIFAELFPGIDKYFTPFLGANQTKHFQRKEIRDILPENNRSDIYLVPQIMSNKADEFVWAIEEIASYGYREMNLNLGCPMPQVAKRRKGSGFLADLDQLDSFFEDSFKLIDQRGLKDLQISVKTRCGVHSHEEADGIAGIYARYPISELIIHPRTRDERYNYTANWDTFDCMRSMAACPVCYNGDLETPEDVSRFSERFSDIDAIMIGRGFLKNPVLMKELLGETITDRTELLRLYHDRIFDWYKATMQDPRQAVCRMKGIWWYLGEQFPECERGLKKVRKAKNTEEYMRAVELIFM